MKRVRSDQSNSAANERATPAVLTSMTYFNQWPNVEDATFSVAVLDNGEFRFEGFSPEAERLTGITNPELVGRTPEEVLPAANAAAVTVRYRQCLREGGPISYLETLEFPTGSSDWRTTLEPVRDQFGRIVRILGRARQIELLDATHEALTEGEFNKALDLFPLGMALLDADGVILFVNSTWEQFGERYGGATRAIGRKYVNVCASSTSAGLPNGPEVAAKLRRLLSEDAEHFGHPYTWGDRHFVLRATRFVLNGKLRIVMAHQDVTDVVTSRELAAQLADDLLQAQEEERARIALELHDSTSQHLAAIGLSLARLQRSDGPSPIIDDIHHSLTEAHREIRTLSYLLYPPKLSSEGLVETLRHFTEGFRRRSSLAVTTTTRGPLDGLPSDVQVAVLRVVQEALGNAQHHANARSVAIEIVLEKGGLRLTVIDDGAAAPTAGKAVPSGVGIRGMQARFAQFGGELTVTHRPCGTTVDGFLPR